MCGQLSCGSLSLYLSVIESLADLVGVRHLLADLPVINLLQRVICPAVCSNTYVRLTALISGTTWVSRYQKGKTNLDFTEARDSEWQWHQLGHMQVCTLLQTDNHASTPPLRFLQARCPSCHPTNSVKALKAVCCKVK